MIGQALMKLTEEHGLNQSLHGEIQQITQVMCIMLGVQCMPMIQYFCVIACLWDTLLKRFYVGLCYNENWLYLPNFRASANVAWFK